jgi:poly-beta-1,6-N-acetyl-D-glucosamine synthase
MTALQWIQGVLEEWNAATLDEISHFQSIEGFLAWLGEYAMLFPIGMCLIWMVFGLLYVLLRESKLPWSDQADLSVAVIVPARNEQSGIAHTLDSLMAQDYPLMTVHVISDASTDETVAAARRYEPRGVVVHDLISRRGKAGALQYALDSIRADLFMVVDADTVCQPDSIRAMVQQFADERVAGVTGSPRVGHASSLLTSMQAMEYIGIIGLIKRADSFWGGLFTVSGAAACFRTSVLRAVGGWSKASVTEDIELSWRMQKAGYDLAYEPRAHFEIQGPRGIVALYKQRIRWARGMWEVLRLHGDLLHTKNMALIPMAAQVIGTAFWMTLALVGVCMFCLRLTAGLKVGSAIDPDIALRMLLISTVLFVSQTFLACTWEGHYRKGMWRYVPFAALYPIYYWLVIAPTFVLGVGSAIASSREKNVNWERTARTATAES